jgi:alpha-maltose-1-phosphate synthase
LKICIIELIRNGGMVHYASQLANALSDQENSMVQVILSAQTDISLFNNKIIIKMVPTIDRHPYRLDIILQHILEFKPDIVHITIRHPLILPLLPFLTLMKVPVFLTVHDVIPHSGEGKCIAEISTRISLHFSRIAFVHGEKLKADLVKRGFSEKKVSVIPHGDYSFFTRLLTENPLSTERSTVLFFGRILDYKGVDYLIQAEPEIAKDIPDLKIIIAGEGDFSKYEKMIVKKDRYEIINRFISDKEVAVLFTRASVIVLPYVEASQTGVVPIAFAFSKPVVATNVGSIPEVVEDGITGIIVPPRDVLALSKAIINLIEDRKLSQKMGIAGKKFMERRMSWNEIGEKIMGLYQKNLK